MSPPDLARPGVWKELFSRALVLMEHLETQTREPHWTFGGGTVLMLRLGHRQSKDIDLFVPDPQYLGYINPRLSEVAEQLSTDYEENAEFIKFYLPVGEIIAKKMWHRGDHAKVRDLYDLCAVAEAEPSALALAAPFMRRHGATFLSRLRDNAEFAAAEFKAIDAIGVHRPFLQSLEQADSIIEPILAQPPNPAQPPATRT